MPYLIWALPSLALALAGGRPLLSSLIFYFCCAFGVFYFVALIVQYYLLLPVLQRCATAWGVAVSALVSAVFIILMTWLTAVQGLNLLLLFRAGPFPVWLVFFVLGLYLGAHRRDYRLRWPLLCVVAGFVASCAETLWLNEQTGVPVVGIKLSAFCYAAAVIVFLFSGRAEQAAVRHGAWLQPLAWVGRLSYGVYLSHLLVLMVLRHFIKFPGWFVEWLVALAATCAMLAALRALLPQRLHRWLALV